MKLLFFSNFILHQMKRNEVLENIVHKQLIEFLKNYSLIISIKELKILEKNNCTDFFIRLEIDLNEFEKTIPDFLISTWELNKKREIRKNGGLFFYTEELNMWSLPFSEKKHNDIQTFVNEILQFVGSPVCDKKEGLVTYFLSDCSSLPIIS